MLWVWKLPRMSLCAYGAPCYAQGGAHHRARGAGAAQRLPRLRPKRAADEVQRCVAHRVALLLRAFILNSLAEHTASPCHLACYGAMPLSLGS